MGTDTRRQTNLDGLLRLPADVQLEVLKYMQPKLIETGHIAVTTKESIIDHGAGVLLKKKIGDFVKKNEILAIMYSNNEDSFGKAHKLIDSAYKISKTKPQKKPLILKTIQ